jgi:hypothetical protein
MLWMGWYLLRHSVCRSLAQEDGLDLGPPRNLIGAQPMCAPRIPCPILSQLSFGALPLIRGPQLGIYRHRAVDLQEIARAGLPAPAKPRNPNRPRISRAEGLDGKV